MAATNLLRHVDDDDGTGSIVQPEPDQGNLSDGIVFQPMAYTCRSQTHHHVHATSSVHHLDALHNLRPQKPRAGHVPRPKHAHLGADPGLMRMRSALCGSRHQSKSSETRTMVLAHVRLWALWTMAKPEHCGWFNRGPTLNVDKPRLKRRRHATKHRRNATTA